MNTKKPNPLAAKILAFLTPTERRTSDEIAQAIGEDPQAVWLELADLSYRGKVLDELVGTPVVRKYRLDARKRLPKCKHDGTFAVVSLANYATGLVKGKVGEAGMTSPDVLCCRCGAMRPIASCNGPRWSAQLAEDMTDPLCKFPEGSALVVHAMGLRGGAELEAAADAASASWADMDYGRRLLYGRLRSEDLPRAERDAAEYARAR